MSTHASQCTIARNVVNYESFQNDSRLLNVYFGFPVSQSATALMEKLAEGTCLLDLASKLSGHRVETPKVPSVFRPKATTSLFLETVSRLPGVQGTDLFTVEDLQAGENYPKVAMMLVKMVNIECKKKAPAAAPRKVKKKHSHKSPRKASKHHSGSHQPQPCRAAAKVTTNEEEKERITLRGLEKERIATPERVANPERKKKGHHHRRRKIDAISEIPEVKNRSKKASVDVLVQRLFENPRFVTLKRSFKSSGGSYSFGGVPIHLFAVDEQVYIQRGSKSQLFETWLRRRQSENMPVASPVRKPLRKPEPVVSDEDFDETEHLRQLLIQMKL